MTSSAHDMTWIVDLETERFHVVGANSSSALCVEVQLGA